MAHHCTTRFANRRIFICVPTREIPRYQLKSDRDYFSRPVEVLLVRTDLRTDLLYVRDPQRNAVFPVATSVLKTFFQLPSKDRARIAAQSTAAAA